MIKLWILTSKFKNLLLDENEPDQINYENPNALKLTSGFEKGDKIEDTCCWWARMSTVSMAKQMMTIDWAPWCNILRLKYETFVSTKTRTYYLEIIHRYLGFAN